MKLNENTVLSFEKCFLVPYEKEHVAKYHAWMESPALREATASERLSLEEEYENQQSWRQNESFCTFIVLDKDFASTPRSIEGMAGDVNLFLNDLDESDLPVNARTIAELDIMIAEERSRRKGLASSACRAMIAYGIQRIGLKTFRVKIGFSNNPSYSLFQQLGFAEVSRSEAFKEVTMELKEGAPDFEALRNIVLEETTYADPPLP